MTKFIKAWHGVIITIVVIMVIFLASAFLPPNTLTLALAFIPIVYTAYHGGLYPGLAAATAIAIAAFFAPGLPLLRGLQIIITAFAIAIPMGILQEQTKLVNNGYLGKITEIRLLTRFLLDHRLTMNDGLIYRFLTEIIDRAGNLEAQIALWKDLREEIEATQKHLMDSQLIKAAEENNHG